MKYQSTDRVKPDHVIEVYQALNVNVRLHKDCNCDSTDDALCPLAALAWHRKWPRELALWAEKKFDHSYVAGFNDGLFVVGYQAECYEDEKRYNEGFQDGGLTLNALYAATLLNVRTQ